MNTNRAVIEAWAGGKVSAGRLLYSDGERLYSDGLVIGLRRNGKRVVLRYDDVPQHTKNHIDSAVLYAQEVR